MGKPLISDGAMRRMYETMHTLRAAKRDPAVLSSVAKGDRALLQAQPESLYAALFSQLHWRDTLLTEGADPLADLGLKTAFPDEGAAPARVVCTGSGEECAALAAGGAMKDAARPGKMKPVSVALLRGFPAMPMVLAMTAAESLPLLLVVRGDALSRADSSRMTATAKIPILPVDESDAVAVCRVFQESLLRARQGLGGAVIHATRLPGAEDPIPGMAQRLRARGLLTE